MGRMLALGVLGLAMLAACSGEGGDTAGGQGAGPGDNPSIVEVLDLLPDTFLDEYEPGEQGGAAQVAQLVRAAEAVGVEPPTPGADEGERLAYLSALSLEGGVDVPQVVEAAEGLEQELGIDMGGLTATALWQGPEGTLDVLVGALDAEAIDDAVEDDEVWGDLLETREHAGLEYYSWGDGGEPDPDLLTDVRPLGLAAQFFVDEDQGVAYWTNSIEVMEMALATFAGDEPSMADSDRYGPLGEAMDDVGAHTSFLAPWFGLDRESALGFAGDEWDGPALLRWEAVAGGAAEIDGGLQAVLAYATDSAEVAEENVGRLEAVLAGNSAMTNAPWTEGSVSVEVDGNLTIATFPAEQPQLPVAAFYRRDSLYFTE